MALVGASYSRNFESDADLYAMQVLDKNHISSLTLANFLARMEDDARAEEEGKAAAREVRRRGGRWHWFIFPKVTLLT